MIKAELKQIILKVVKDYKISENDVAIEIPKDKKFGDFATSIALKIGKSSETNPKKIARDIAGKIKSNMIEKIEVAGPGFLNFFLAPKYLQDQISEIIKTGDQFGTSDKGKGKKVQVEFISANPTGPLTLGNGRGGFMGDALANVLSACGYKVAREYYINDTGNQVKELGESIIGKGDHYKGKYLDEIKAKIKSDDPIIAGQKAAKIIMAEMIKPVIEKKMKIKFDQFFSESSLYESGKVVDAIEHLKSKDLMYGKDGALWFRSQKLGDDKDRVLKRKDGQFTYFASDIAYHLDKFDRGFDRVIDFWGADHFGYVNRLKLALEALGFKNKLDIIVVQLVRLVKDGKEMKMSKRAGTFVTLDELIQEVGLDVARFFFLMNAAGTHMDFDLGLAKEKSQKNPVFYVQYACARINSILNKSKLSNSKFQTNPNVQNLKLLKEKEEMDLIKKMIEFPDLIAEISQNYQVQGLPFYVMELADSFHKFYEKHQVISKDKKMTQARLALISACAQVLKNTFGLMEVSAPEKM
jgi:arginyl-tRNA synthetase